MTTPIFVAINKCSQRGLRVSTEFVAEMLVATSSQNDHQTTSVVSASEAQSPLYLLAKACFDRGEYQRAAHILRNVPLAPSQTTTTTTTTTTTVGCDFLAYFVRCYSLYLAGEKRVDEVQAERGGPSTHWAPGMSQTPLPSDAPDPSGNGAPGANGPNAPSSAILGGRSGRSGNENLPLLYGELNNLYESQLLDGFLLYLFGVVLRDLGMPKEAQDMLCEAVVAYPLNWSAWLDLVKLCPDKASLDHVEQSLNSFSGRNDFIGDGNNWIGQCFKGYALMELQEHEEAIGIYEDLLQQFPNCTYINGLLAKTNYNAREYDQARQLYEQLRSNDPYRLDGMDLYSNILFVKTARAQLSHLAHSAMKIDKYRPQTCCIVGNYYSLKGQHERAILYFRRALKLDPHYLAAWTLMGHEYVELQNTQAAIQAYRRAVDIDARDYRAWYGLGQTYEILKMYHYAIYYYRKAVQLRPYDSRMWLGKNLWCYISVV